MTEKIPFQTSRTSFQNFKSAGKNLPPNASNLKICSIIGERSLFIKTIFKFMESHGEQTKIRKIWNFFVISHAKDNEGSMLALSWFDPNVRIFDFFLDFCPLKNSIRVSFYFSGIQSTLLNMLIQFSKKSESKNFRPKSLNLP